MRILALLLLSLFALSGCGQSARDKALHATYDTTNIARAEFREYSIEHQRSLVEAHPGDSAAQRVAVDEWRSKRERIVEIFEATYRALAAAAIVSDDQSLSGVGSAARTLSDELRSLGVRK